MREASRTTREQIADRLREETLTASALAREFEIGTTQALDHVQHIARTLDSTDETLLASPPTCEDCGFDEFDDVANRPSRCPECHSETVAEPAFQVA